MKVSIIIPFLNASSTIKRCIESAVSQTYNNIEIICVDNGSNDESVKILQDYIINYKHIKLYTELRKGANFARNLGIKKASGSWLNFLDADDFISKKKIENQVKTLKTKYPFIASSYYYVNLNGHKRKHKIKYLDPWKDLFSGNLGITSSNLFKKTNVIDVGMWNEDYNSSQEADLMFRLIKKYGFPYLIKREFDTIVYQQKSSISNTNRSDNLRTFLNLRILILDHLKKFEGDYFESNKQWFLNELLTITLQCYVRNEEHSISVFKKYIKADYKISNDNTFYRNLLILIINLFGFKAGAFLYAQKNQN